MRERENERERGEREGERMGMNSIQTMLSNNNGSKKVNML